MSKKKIIITQKQLDEICGADFAYLDGLALRPDMGDIFSTETVADGAVDDGYADPVTADDYSHDLTNDWRGNAKLAGMGPGKVNFTPNLAIAGAIREMSKKDWEANLMAEEEEHGNARLKHMKFGAKDGEQGKNYDATKMNLSRYNAAETKSKSTDPTLKQQGLSTMATMEKNWPGIKNAQVQYRAAKQGDKSNQKHIASAPKQDGNGKAHSPKGGILTT